jgi:hypothetical protein
MNTGHKTVRPRYNGSLSIRIHRMSNGRHNKTHIRHGLYSVRQTRLIDYKRIKTSSPDFTYEFDVQSQKKKKKSVRS